MIPLGVLNEGESRQILFTVYNHSTYTRIINRIDTSCNCFSVVDSPDSIPAGKSAEIVLKMTADSVAGSFKRQAKVFFDNTPAPLLLTVNGFVK